MVIGCGNPLRGDDAVAHHVVDALQVMPGLPAQTELVKVHQLDVVLAETIASRDLVVFVDAAVGPADGATLRTIPIHAEPVVSTPFDSHALTPAALLAVAAWLYGRAPRAALVTAAAHDLSHGAGLSERITRAVPQAAHVVMEMLLHPDA